MNKCIQVLITTLKVTYKSIQFDNSIKLSLSILKLVSYFITLVVCNFFFLVIKQILMSFFLSHVRLIFAINKQIK